MEYIGLSCTDGRGVAGGGVREGRLLAPGPRDDGAAQPGQVRQRAHQGAQVSGGAGRRAAS